MRTEWFYFVIDSHFLLTYVMSSLSGSVTEDDTESPCIATCEDSFIGKTPLGLSVWLLDSGEGLKFFSKAGLGCD